MPADVYSMDCGLAVCEERAGTRFLRATVLKDGIYDMPRSDLKILPPGVPEKDTYRVRRGREVIFSDLVRNNVRTAPLMFDDHYTPTLPNLRDHGAGFPVGDPKSNTDAGELVQEYQLVSEKAIAGFDAGSHREVSMAFRANYVLAPEGSDFDLDMVSMDVEHVALVDQGRAGPHIRAYERKEPDMALSAEDVAAIVAGLKPMVTEAVQDALKVEERSPNAPEVKDRRSLEVQLAEAKEYVKDRALVEGILGTSEERVASFDAIEQAHGESAEGSRQILGMALAMTPDEISGTNIGLIRDRATRKLAEIQGVSQERADSRVEQRAEPGATPVYNMDAYRKTVMEAANKGKATLGADIA